MTADAVLTPVPPPRPEPSDVEPPDAESPGRATMVRLIRESFATVEPHAEDFAQYFYALLFTLSPRLRDLFPVNLEVQRSRLLRALVHVVQMVDRPAEL